MSIYTNTVHNCVYILTTVDSADIDKKAKIPEDVMGGLRDLGLFGLLIPEKYGELKGFTLVCFG